MPQPWRPAATLLALVLAALPACRADPPPQANGPTPTTVAKTAEAADSAGVVDRSVLPPSLDPRHDPARVDVKDLRPTLATAPTDTAGLYDNGCHARPPETVAKPCVLGDPDGSRTVVALGDSHMANWWKALDTAARTHGWRLVWLSKSGCPAADVTIDLEGKPYAECDTWRRAALTRVAALRRVDLVVLTGSHASQLRSRRDRAALAGRARAGEWASGTARTLADLRPYTASVVLLRDTPQMPADVPACLRRGGGAVAACSRRRLPSPGLWRLERSVAASRPGVSTVDATGLLCTSSRCRPVTGSGVLRWRDDHHLTATFTALLAPYLWRRLMSAAGTE